MKSSEKNLPNSVHTLSTLRTHAFDLTIMVVKNMSSFPAFDLKIMVVKDGSSFPKGYCSFFMKAMGQYEKSLDFIMRHTQRWRTEAAKELKQFV